MTTYIRCTFEPETWVNDYARPADPQGPTQWQMDMTEVTELTGVTDMHHMDNDPYARDELRNSRHAPLWVKNWSGPFEVSWEIIGKESKCSNSSAS